MCVYLCGMNVFLRFRDVCRISARIYALIFDYRIVGSMQCEKLVLNRQ